MAGMPGYASLFGAIIVLKPGVDYSHGRGTFVVGDSVVVASRRD